MIKKIAVLDAEAETKDDSHRQLTCRFRNLGFTICRSLDELDSVTVKERQDYLLVHAKDFESDGDSLIAFMTGEGNADHPLSAQILKLRDRVEGIWAFSLGRPLETWKSDAVRACLTNRYLADADAIERWFQTVPQLAEESEADEAKVELLHALLSGEGERVARARETLEKLAPKLDTLPPAGWSEPQQLRPFRERLFGKAR